MNFSVTCLITAVDNGVGPSTALKHGEVFTLTCNYGYEPAGASTFTCNMGEYDPPLTGCKKSRCTEYLV